MQSFLSFFKNISWTSIDYKKEAKNFVLLTFGALLSALAIHMFYKPFDLAMGGVSGISLIMVHLFHFIPLSIGMWIFLLNLPIFLISFKEFGPRFTLKGLIGTFFFSACIDLSTPFFSPLAQELKKTLHGVLPDFTMISVVGGALFGIGLAIIFLAGYTTGGTDMIVFVIRKHFKSLSTGILIYILDFIVISLSMLLLNNTEAGSPLVLALYSFLSLFITAKSIDFILEGVNIIRAAYIISDKADEISQKVLSELSRGVTGIHGKGMYTQNNKTILLCVLSTKEIPHLKKLVASIDERAFIIVSPAHEVLGEGFEESAHF